MSVLDDLRYWRDKMVTDYGAIKLANELTQEITAFPGGTGFLAGEPSHRPVMVVCHNYDGENNAYRPVDYHGSYWLTLCEYLDGADVPQEHVFLTNVLMGLRPGQSGGEMKDKCSPLFIEQCISFFAKQAELVRPELVIVCGDEAKKLLVGTSTGERVYVAHPSSNQTSIPENRTRRAAKHVAAIRAALERIGYYTRRTG